MSTKNVYVLLAWSGTMIAGLSTVIGATESNLKASILGNTYCFLDVKGSISILNNMGYCSTVVSFNAILICYVLITTFVRYNLISSYSIQSINSAFINFIVSSVATLMAFINGIVFIAGWYNTCYTIKKVVANSQCDVVLMQTLNFKVNSIQAAVAFSFINFLGMLYLMYIDYKFWQRRKTKRVIPAPRIGSSSVLTL